MKLTHYISLRYIGATILAMVIAIPLFYIVIQKVLINNIDEHLEDQKTSIAQKLQNIPTQNFVNFDDRVTIATNPKKHFSEKIFTNTFYNAKDNETESFRILEFPVQSAGVAYNVQIKQSLVESEDLLKSILYLLISLVFLLTGTLLLINYQIKKKVWEPFYKTLDQLKNFRIDDQNELHLKTSTISELNDLNNSLNELSTKNQKVYQSQKEFTENASHELQTPLAIVQNNIELFWQTEPISEQQAEILNDISTATSRMGKLNKALLLLSKIENRQFNDIQSVNLNGIAEHFFRNYQEQIKSKNIDLKTDLEESFIVEMDFSLAEILVGNLLLNALKYAPKDSMVEVIFTKNEMSISNQAERLALFQEKLFKRFQRQNTQENSTGLGLEIAKQIAVSFNLNLNYAFKNGRHFFIVKKK